MPRRPFRVTALTATMRTVSARHPAAARAVVLGLAVLTGSRVWSAQHAAEAARRSWGEVRTVWVVDRPVGRGGPVVTRAEQYPVAVVPPDAIDEPPEGARAARRLIAGTVLEGDDLLGDGTVPEGWVVLAVPVDGAPPVVDGDPVSLFAPDRSLCDGVVHAISTNAVSGSIAVAVPPSCAASAVTALVDRSVVLARRIVDPVDD